MGFPGYGAASCGAVANVFPFIGGLHGKRPVGRAHHEPLTGFVLPDLVGVGESAAEKPGDEGNPRTGPERPGGLPLHRLDVGVPVGCVVEVGGVSGDFGSGTQDLDLGLHIHFHAEPPPVRSAAVEASNSPRRSRIDPQPSACGETCSAGRRSCTSTIRVVSPSGVRVTVTTLGSGPV